MLTGSKPHMHYSNPNTEIIKNITELSLFNEVCTDLWNHSFCGTAPLNPKNNQWTIISRINLQGLNCSLHSEGIKGKGVIPFPLFTCILAFSESKCRSRPHQYLRKPIPPNGAMGFSSKSKEMDSKSWTT